MLKILTTQQLRALDSYTIQHEPIASIDLMERACRAFCSWFVQQFDESKRVGIVCGTGNNGGDGLGIARLLLGWGYDVKVWVVRGLVAESADFKVNLERLAGRLEAREIIAAPGEQVFAGCDVLIDALFGSGLTRPPEGIYAQTIDCINQSGATRVAVDMPSGLLADGPSAGAIVKADYTVTFQLPKLAFMLPQSHPYVGEWVIVDIGLDKNFINGAECHRYLLTKRGIRKILKHRSKFDHKGKFGHALLVAGSYGKMGAAVLAARAALRSGPGLVTVHIPAHGYTVLQTAVPEAMVSVDVDTNYISSVADLANYAAIGVGPGLGVNKQVIKALAQLMEKYNRAMVLDADALNVVSTDRALFGLIPKGSILTPHPGEFERLVGSWKDDFERLQKQIELSSTLKSVILVKGAHTAIASPDGDIYFNNTGNAGMAKGGSGDALTGILTGLLSRGYSSLEAAQLGCWLHGLAGDLAVHEKGVESLTASDLIEKLPDSFRSLK